MKKRKLKAMREAALKLGVKAKTDLIDGKKTIIRVDGYRALKKYFKKPENKKELDKIKA